MFLIFASLVSVAFLWGATNPLIKKGSVGIKKIQAESSLKTFLLELKFLITNWKYLLPMALNQSGSILYFFTLQNADLSLAVPVTNSLTFIFTAISSWLLGENLPNKNTLIGMTLILVGAIFCFLDKL